MGRETILFKNEEKMTRAEAATLLRNIADRLDKGKVTLSKGKENLQLKIPRQVEIELKAEKEEGKKRRKKKLEIEIEWLVGGKAQDTSPMKIK